MFFVRPPDADESSTLFSFFPASSRLHHAAENSCVWARGDVPRAGRNPESYRKLAERRCKSTKQTPQAAANYWTFLLLVIGGRIGLNSARAWNVIKSTSTMFSGMIPLWMARCSLTMRRKPDAQEKRASGRCMSHCCLEINTSR